jgi:hypothetical protein
MRLYGNRFEVRRRAIVRKYAPQFFNILKGQYQSFLSAVNNHGIEYAKKHMDSIISAGTSIDALKKLYRTAAWLESNQTLGYVRQGYKVKRMGGPKFRIGFDDLAPIIDQYFEIYKWNQSAFPIAETTKKTITRYLVDRLDQGIPLDQALKEFRELAIDSRSSLSRQRAEFIAQTESHRSMNFGGMIGAYMSGVDLDKVWITAHDARVRPTRDHPTIFSHRDLEGVKKDLMEAFYNNEKIDYPGDPNASFENTAGCRCSLIYLEKKKPKPPDLGRELGNFITDFFLGFIAAQISQLLTNNEQ